jgi:hypothetical protein
MKTILNNSTTNTTDKMIPLLQNNTSMFVDKTNILMNDFFPKIVELFPKNQETIVKELSHVVKNIQQFFIDETKKISNNNIDKNTLEQFVSQFDSKFSNYVAQTESRLDKKLSEVRDISIKSQNIEETLQTNISQLLKKMENSSIKGKISENILFNILVTMFPLAEVNSVGSQKETGDIILIRTNKPKILIENKNYNCNVNNEEVKKFIRDTEIQNCCCLFLSQNHGICNKENFYMEIKNNNVLLYLHEVNNNPEKIKLGIEMIDSLKSILDKISKHSDGIIHMSDEDIEELNKEYCDRLEYKLEMIKNIKIAKEAYEKISKGFDYMFELPSLEKFLSLKYGTSQFTKKNTSFHCKHCDYVGKNQQSLSAHLRGCKIIKEK